MTLLLSTAPEQGQLVNIRQRRFVVSEVAKSALPNLPLQSVSAKQQHLVTLSSVEDDALGEELQVIWELEPGASIIERVALPEPTGFDSPERLSPPNDLAESDWLAGRRKAVRRDTPAAFANVPARCAVGRTTGAAIEVVVPDFDFAPIPIVVVAIAEVVAAEQHAAASLIAIVIQADAAEDITIR